MEQNVDAGAPMIPVAENEQKGGKGLKIKSPASGETIMEMLTASIFSALKTLGLIAGYLVLFTIAADFMELTGILQRFPGNFGKGLLSGIMEVTVGCSYVSGSGLPPALLCTLCAFLISFGGLSVMAQSMSVLTGSGISPLYYLKTKFMHGILASLIAWFTAPHILQAAASAGAFGESTSSAAMFPQQWLFSSQLLILVLILLGVTILLGKIKTP